MLLVSHDREFMDNVVTSLLVVEGNGVISDHAGGYSDWLARGGRLAEASGEPGRAVATTPGPAAAVVAAQKKRSCPIKTSGSWRRCPP